MVLPVLCLKLIQRRLCYHPGSSQTFPCLLPASALGKIISSKQRLKSAFLGLMSNRCAAGAEGYPGTRELCLLLLK